MRKRLLIGTVGAAIILAGVLALGSFAAGSSEKGTAAVQAPAKQQFSTMMENMGAVMHAMAGQMHGSWNADTIQSMHDHMVTMADMMRQMSGMMGRMKGHAAMGHGMGMMGSNQGHGMMDRGMMMGSDMKARMDTMREQMTALMQACGVENSGT